MFPVSDENPHSIRPFVTWLLIVTNIVVFVWQIAGSEVRFERILATYGFVPSSAFGQGTYHMFVTSMFLHSNFLHLFGNMLYLWIFGDNVEDMCGHSLFLFFYVLSGAAASFIYSFFASDPTIPAVGASGAISGVLGGYLVLFPNARVRTLVFFGWFARSLYVPAFVTIGLWFVYQLLYALVGAQTGVAYWAHVGGFLAGIVLVKPLARRRDRHPLYGYLRRNWYTHWQ